MSNKPFYTATSYVETSHSYEANSTAITSSQQHPQKKRLKMIEGDGGHTLIVAEDPSILLDNANKSRINHSNFKGDSDSFTNPARSCLRDLCHAKRWNLPLYECCHEEGPSHRKRYTFKVSLKIEGNDSMVLECFGAPMPSKKKAAAHAAEGVLWYLSHPGLSSKTNK